MKSFHFEANALLHSIWLPMIFIVITCTLLLKLGFDVAAFMKAEPAPSVVAEQSLKKVRQPKKPPSDLLFGTYVPVNFNSADIQQSSLNIRVVGVLYSVQEEQSQVLLHTEGGDEKVYHVGDEIPGGAVIKKIEPHGIVILSHGQLEQIQLPKNPLKFERRSTRIQSRLLFKE